MFVDKTEIDHREDGTTVYMEAYSHSVPSPMPTPASIGFDASYKFRPGSTIYIVSTGALYMADEDGSWVLQ